MSSLPFSFPFPFFSLSFSSFFSSYLILHGTTQRHMHTLLINSILQLMSNSIHIATSHCTLKPATINKVKPHHTPSGLKVTVGSDLSLHTIIITYIFKISKVSPTTFTVVVHAEKKTTISASNHIFIDYCLSVVLVHFHIYCLLVTISTENIFKIN